MLLFHGVVPARMAPSTSHACATTSPSWGRRDLEFRRHETVHLCGWLELANRVNGETPFEVPANSDALYLLLHGRRRPPRDSISRRSTRNQACPDSVAMICFATLRKSGP